jgi:hypothetical protein
MQRTHANLMEERPQSNLVRDILAVLVVALLVWSVWLQVQVRKLDAQVAKLNAPITVTGQPGRQFSSVNDLALALLQVHEREQGLEKSIEEDIHGGGRTLIHTHQYIDRKVWAADSQSKDMVSSP